jgi:hypothetical protein
MIFQNVFQRIFSMMLFALLCFINIHVHAQIKGCTDPLAINFNAAAGMNDGSCVYSPVSVNASASTTLPIQMKGTSGLIWMNNKLWTQNNFSDINLYSFLPDQVNSFQTTPLTGTTNIDWEEMAQDEVYLYIGDLGNNVNGNRTNLQILRITKSSLQQPPLIIDTIAFSYATQTNFNPAGANNTNYDCEAFIVSNDSIYLFTKEWLTNKTSVYRLPKTKGTHTASWVTTFDTQGLITGASFLESKRLLVLCGYNSSLQPFLYLLYDYPGNRFFEGNKRKILLNLPFHQVEAIATLDGLNYHITNESFQQSVINVPQKLHQLNLGSYLSGYLSTTSAEDHFYAKGVTLYPVPATTHLYADLPEMYREVPYRIINSAGGVVMQGVWKKARPGVDISGLASGSYWMIFSADRVYVRQWVKP